MELLFIFFNILKQNVIFTKFQYAIVSIQSANQSYSPVLNWTTKLLNVSCAIFQIMTFVTSILFLAMFQEEYITDFICLQNFLVIKLQWNVVIFKYWTGSPLENACLIRSSSSLGIFDNCHYFNVPKFVIHQSTF